MNFALQKSIFTIIKMVDQLIRNVYKGGMGKR